VKGCVGKGQEGGTDDKKRKGILVASQFVCWVMGGKNATGKRDQKGKTGKKYC